MESIIVICHDPDFLDRLAEQWTAIEDRPTMGMHTFSLRFPEGRVYVDGDGGIRNEFEEIEKARLEDAFPGVKHFYSVSYSDRRALRQFLVKADLGVCIIDDDVSPRLLTVPEAIEVLTLGL